MDERPHFKDIATKEDTGGLEGKKVKFETIVNREILITDFECRKSNYQSGEYMILQFKDNNEVRVTFTGAGVIRAQLERHREQLPLWATIVKKNRYYTLS
jgi:hypothetical protein